MTKRRKPDSRIDEEMLREEEIRLKVESILDEEDEEIREEMILGLDEEELDALDEAMDEEEEDEYLEPLYEMATVGHDAKLSIIVEVNPDSKRIGNEYFKAYDSSSKEKAKRVCRILFREPRYVEHRRGRGLSKKMGSWVMNTKERKNLIEFLSEMSDTFPELTVWQTAIVLFNIEKGLPRSKTMENFMDDMKHPDYLPIDLPMPDYTQLGN